MENEKLDQPKIKNKSKLLFILIGSGLVVAILLVCLFCYWNNVEEDAIISNNNIDLNYNNMQTNKVIFPNGLDSLIGQSEEEAKEKLENSGLNVEISEITEFSETIPRGKVIKWQGIRYTGNWHYKYEELNDLEISAYQDTLKDNPVLLQSVLYEKIYEYDKLSDINLIEGDTITLTISKGKEIKMPNLLGMTEDKAKQTIEENKLKYKETLTGSDLSYDENTIIDQSISAGTMIEEDTEISITLNKQIRNETLSINVKSMNYSNKEMVDLLVKANGKEIFNQAVDGNNKNQIVDITVGNIVNIEIYIDNSLKYSQEIDLREKTSSNAPIYITSGNTNVNNNDNNDNNDGDYTLDLYDSTDMTDEDSTNSYILDIY